MISIFAVATFLKFVKFLLTQQIFKSCDFLRESGDIAVSSLQTSVAHIGRLKEPLTFNQLHSDGSQSVSNAFCLLM